MLKKGVLKNFAIYRKTTVLSIFDKIPGLQACDFIKNRLQFRCFVVNIVKFLRTPVLKNICERLLLTCKQLLLTTNMISTLNWSSDFAVNFQYIHLLSNDHLFSTYAKFSEKLVRTFSHQGVRTVSFSEDFAYVLNNV